MANKYSARWTAGLSPQEKENLEQFLSGNQKVLDRLSEICYNMINEAESLSNDYDSPNWALRQADSVGYRRALTGIIKLCTQSNKIERTMTNG